MSNKQKYSYILIGIFIFAIYLIIVVFSFFQNNKKVAPSLQKTRPTITLSPSRTISPSANKSLIKYDKSKTNQMLEIVKNRPQLSQKDLAVRTSLIKNVNNTSGYLHTTSTYKLEYVKSADSFIGELTTINIQDAKADAVLWLKNQGLSEEGICILPLSFYINRATALKLKNSNFVFNPLPEQCQ